MIGTAAQVPSGFTRVPVVAKGLDLEGRGSSFHIVLYSSQFSVFTVQSCLLKCAERARIFTCTKSIFEIWM